MDIVTAAKSDLLDEYARDLVKKGMKKVGQGTFAYVFKHPTYSNMVVRVSDVSDVGNEWLHRCAKYPNNPWLPKVAAQFAAVVVNRKKRTRTRIIISFVERLTKPFYFDYARRKGGRLWDVMYQLQKLGLAPRGIKEWGLILQRLDNATVKFADPYFTQAMKLMFKPPRGNGKVHFDLLEFNFRMRGDQIVINDPWWRSNKDQVISI